METLTFTLASSPAGPAAPQPVICGVVGSGNLEVLVRPDPQRADCRIAVNTSAEGFRDTWQAVLESFAARHAVAGIDIEINDWGATPAVVTLRLEQALSAYLGDAR